MEQTNPRIRIKFLIEFKELFNESWRFLIYHGGRNSGKSTSVALALLLRGRSKKLRILCTREIQNTIADSVHKLLKDLITKYELTDYEVLKDRITNTVTGTEFIFKGLHNNTTEIKSTEGVDICWVEEAHSITKDSIDLLVPTIRKSGSQIIFTFNRMAELDPVYVHFCINNPPNTYVKHVNYDVLERVGLLTKEIKEEIEYDRQNDPELFAHKWKGEPISQSDKAILARRNILEAMSRTISDDGQYIYGVDVARMGNDRTVFYKRKGLQSKEMVTYKHLKTVEA